MLCLGGESSCDDSSLALVRDGVLLGERTASQIGMHALFGGVVPELASREHARLMGPLCDLLLHGTGCRAQDIDVVAVARGPGLLGSLLVGVAFAKAFALGTGARFIGVNHLHAHLFAPALERQLILPAMGLLVSGGHTQLYRVEGPDKVFALGRTLDDAAGEAFDKAGKMLGLPYPAGRQMDILAGEGRAEKGLFPRPYLDNDNLDFSFSGLKTAMGTYLARQPELKATWDARSLTPQISDARRKMLADLCASYRLAVVETLIVKVERALAGADMADVRALILAGGVAANSLLRSTMRAAAKKRGLDFFAPSPALCTDNGAMIGYLGWRLASMGYEHGLDMEAVPRGRKVPEDMLRVG